MARQKHDGKKGKKNGQLVIRLEKAERDAFVKACRQRDTSAAREIRRFMRDWLAANPGEIVPSPAPAEPGPPAAPPAAGPEPVAVPPATARRKKAGRVAEMPPGA
jgi:hypothetical protein